MKFSLFHVRYKIQTNIGKHFYLWNVFKRITVFDLILNVTDGVKKLSFKSHLDSEFCKVCHFHKIYFSWNLFSPPRHLPSRGCRQETIGPSVFSFPSVTQGVVVVVDTEPSQKSPQNDRMTEAESRYFSNFILVVKYWDKEDIVAAGCTPDSCNINYRFWQQTLSTREVDEVGKRSFSYQTFRQT